MQTLFRPLALALGLGLLILMGLAACGVRQLTTGDLQPPKVSWQGLAVSRPTPQGWPLTVTLLLTNPNNQALNLKGYDYELWLEGKPVAQGASDAAVDLPAGGQTVAQVPILVQVPALMGMLPALLTPEPPPLHYQVMGGFRLAQVMGGLVRAPFHFQGQVTPKQGLKILRQYLR